MLKRDIRADNAKCQVYHKLLHEISSVLDMKLPLGDCIDLYRMAFADGSLTERRAGVSIIALALSNTQTDRVVI